MSVYRLDDELFDFPSPEEADDEYDGLLAVGGDYNPERPQNGIPFSASLHIAGSGGLVIIACC